MNWLKQNWFKIVAILFLLGALANNPYGYYQFLRWVILIIGTYSAYSAYKIGSKAWTWIFVTIAVLFNPIIPFALQRGTWQSIDIMVAIVFFISLFIKEDTKKV